MRALCCPSCFGDRGLRRNIIPTKSSVGGTCGYCGETATSGLIDPRELSDVFEMLIGIYEPSTNGRPLVQWLKEDWKLFPHPKMDDHRANSLLAEILDSGEIVRRSFQPSEAYISEGLIRWESLRDEILFKNRYFLDQELDLDRLKSLLAFLPADDLPGRWFRARIVAGDGFYALDKMGAPPKELAAHGRANPVGIPYLYLGSMPQTAVAEVRPHTGEVACVAEFVMRRQISAIDLRDPRALVSPFLLEDSGAIGQLRADIPFLERLGAELTRPVLPRSAALDYIPSQYLCEFIKKSGYDGVVYRSSVSDGINLALFDPAVADGQSVLPYDVRKVSVEVLPSPGQA